MSVFSCCLAISSQVLTKCTKQVVLELLGNEFDISHSNMWIVYMMMLNYWWVQWRSLHTIFGEQRDKIQPKIKHNWENDGTDLQCAAQIISGTQPIRPVIQSCKHCSIFTRHLEPHITETNSVTPSLPDWSWSNWTFEQLTTKRSEPGTYVSSARFSQ